MHKKKLLVSILAISILIFVLTLYYNTSEDTNIVLSSNNSRITSSNAITMMYETEAGSGEYQVTSDTTWPQEGYVFNDRLSKCENGSELSWDDENKRVIMSTSVSDK